MNKMTDNTAGIDGLKKEIDLWKGKYLRALADYQNLEKRIQNLRNEESRFASKNILLKVLTILDVLEKIEKTTDDEGIKLAVKLFRKILDEEKVTRIEVLNKRFDPLYMECVEVDDSGRDGIVSEEVKAGYMIFDQILRVALVKVGKSANSKKEMPEKEAK